MRRCISRLLILFGLWSVVHPRPVHAVKDLVDQENLARRIFDGEEKTIALFAKTHPIVETYAQSLNNELSPEDVIDDAYFLSRVSLDADSPRGRMLQTFAFGRTSRSRQIKVNTGDRWPLYPEGYVDMLFVDRTDFNQQYYSLRYEETEMLGNTECLRVAVTPVEPKGPGQFQGNIWVETTGLHIVRIDGDFTPRHLTFAAKYLNVSGFSRLGIYLHFESRRQEVSPGVWMPTYSAFDDQSLWRQTKLNTSYHLRGQTWVWGYREEVNEGTAVQKLVGTDPLSRLEAEGLIASNGQVEKWLDGIVHDIQLSGHRAGPEIHCRILMTTPIEMFAVGNNIVISRGLLNVIPNESILAVLLAREMAHIVVGLDLVKPSKVLPIFDDRRMSEFRGFGVLHRTADSTEVKTAMVEILGNRYAGAVSLTEQFETLLANRSSTIPHLLHAGFGFSVVDGTLLSSLPSITLVPHTDPVTLTLRSDFGINPWENEITMSVRPDMSELSATKGAYSREVFTDGVNH